MRLILILHQMDYIQMECTEREDNKGMFLAVTARCEKDRMASREKEPKWFVPSAPCVPALKFNTQPDAGSWKRRCGFVFPAEPSMLPATIYSPTQWRTRWQVLSDHLELLHYCMLLHLIPLVLFCYAASHECSCVAFLKQTYKILYFYKHIC